MEEWRSVAITDKNTFVISKNGVICFWNTKTEVNGRVKSVQIGGGNNQFFVSIAGSSELIVALDSNGDIWCSQLKMEYYLFKMDQYNNICAIYIFKNQFFALDEEGYLWVGDFYGNKRLENPKLPPIYSCSINELRSAIDIDGNVLCWKSSSCIPYKIKVPFQRAIYIHSTEDYLLIIGNNGKLWKFNYNDKKVIPMYHNIPIPLVKIFSSEQHTIILDEEGSAWSWGNNGALGLKYYNHPFPCLVSDMPPIHSAFCTSSKTLVLSYHGELFKWKNTNSVIIKGIPVISIPRSTAKSARSRIES